jgi:outer membrane protein TolC
MRFIFHLLLCLALLSPAGAAEEETAEDFPEITPGNQITLSEALKLADQRNLTLNAARTDIIKAQAELYSAWSTLLPVASGNLDYTFNDHADTREIGGNTVEVSKQQNLRGGLLVNMPLVSAQAWVGVVLGDTGVEVAEVQVEKVRQALLLSVAQAYFQALTARSLIEVQHNQINSSKRHLAVATIRHRSGTGSRLDVIRAQTELLTAREELLKAHTSLDNSRDALAILIGVEGLPLPVEIPDTSPPEGGEEDLVAQAKLKNEDVKLTRALVELADEQVTMSWMNFLPSLYASWTLTQQISERGGFSSPDNTRWFIGLTLSVPIYDNTRYADLDQKRASLARAELEAEDTRQQVALAVRQARRDYENAIALVSTAQKKVTLAAQSLELAETAYENGTGSSLDVTDARRSSRTAEIDLATKRFGAQLALLTLLRTAGEDMRTIGQH